MGEDVEWRPLRAAASAAVTEDATGMPVSCARKRSRLLSWLTMTKRNPCRVARRLIAAHWTGLSKRGNSSPTPRRITTGSPTPSMWVRREPSVVSSATSITSICNLSSKIHYGLRCSSTQGRTRSRASDKRERSRPPAWASVGLPPPPPPTTCATILTSLPA